MKQKIKQLSRQFCITVSTLIVSACSNGYEFNFKTPQDAISACESELHTLMKSDKTSTKDLLDITNKWNALQDSTRKVISRADSLDNNHPLIHRFFILADSIQTQITTIAQARERTVDDVVYLKINTTFALEKIQKSKNYKEAISFYENLDKSELFPSAQSSIEEYNKLFKTIEEVKKENDLLNYITKEDQCYRSILKYRNQLKNSELEVIAEETENFFNSLQYAVTQKDNEQNSRLLAYLNIRLNRRIIQYAETSVAMIENKIKMEDDVRETCRWAILQPYISIDKYMATYLTQEQKESLTNIGSKLPEYLIYLDGKAADVNKKELDKLSRVLANTLLSMYLKQNL